MATLLDSSQFGQVRAVIDVGLTTSNLPDDTINQDIFVATAIQDVLDVDPAAESRSGDDLDRAKRAAVYFCAARLCPVVIRLTSVNVQTKDVSYSRKTFDPQERAAELRQMAHEEIQAILAPSDDTPNMPTMFDVASGTRGY